MTRKVSFSLCFCARMSSTQADWLRSELGLTFHGRPRPPACAPFAFGLLDRYSGLFLIDEGENQWRLECRTYREPTPERIAGWKADVDWVVERLRAIESSHDPSTRMLRASEQLI